ncbi:hypothetical protein [Pseudoteredinibacter isoporae]|uniref:Uncharacterized protein n=1 Tax=Pseudoteredinibacter isoporae TaxID=570281 RepID=A0A7X0JT77_9GAMM|nr:hypothetical protein [Pseudoteredinibacter isoporae]MBB6521414.1 hypothetical protein [Pseudoteredinibacter isoporae]NHO86969.1 hypothetical protein [Pseudoteredinibacter isoporae]NIB24578.1 hypothetical protein [Pseudoteredinibacter isoporae]
MRVIAFLLGCACMAIVVFPYLITAALNAWEYLVGALSGGGQDTFYKTVPAEDSELGIPYLVVIGVGLIVYGLPSAKKF